MARSMQLRHSAGRRTRGATPLDASPRTSSLLRRLVPLLFLLLLVMSVDLGVRAFRDVANVPIKEVSVNGDLRFLDPRVVERLIMPHLGIGYFLVDLQGIRAELEELPLVHEVTVRRAWPDRLLVFMTEQVPVVRLGETAYLNPYAERFEPEAPLPVDLPMVNGPPGSEHKLLDSFRQFSEMLEPSGLGLSRLELDGKHAWRATLDTGTEVLLGRRDAEQRFATLVTLLGEQLRDERDQLRRIDMRYSNGISVLRGASVPDGNDHQVATINHTDRVN